MECIKSKKYACYVQNAHAFNQPLNTNEVTRNDGSTYMAWDVSNVADMGGMFSYAIIFNQPLNNWNVSNVENMNNMFKGAISFNQPLNNWDPSNVTSMEDMFWNSGIENNPPHWFDENIIGDDDNDDGW